MVALGLPATSNPLMPALRPTTFLGPAWGNQKDQAWPLTVAAGRAGKELAQKCSCGHSRSEVDTGQLEREQVPTDSVVTADGRSLPCLASVRDGPQGRAEGLGISLRNPLTKWGCINL